MCCSRRGCSSEFGYVTHALRHARLRQERRRIRPRHLPRTGGRPRQCARPVLAQHPNVDPDRIGVIGSSFGGAVAVYAGGINPRIAAVISNGGWGHGERKFRGQHPTPEAWAKFTKMLEDGRAYRERTGQSMMVPRYDIVPIPNHVKENLAKQNVGMLAPNSVEMFPAETAQSMFDFRAEDVVGKIAPRPLLLIHSAKDSVTPTEQSIEMFKRAGQPSRTASVCRPRSLPVRRKFDARLEPDAPLARHLLSGRSAAIMSGDKIVVGHEELKRFIRDVLVFTGAGDGDADTVADGLVWANLRGVDGHGVSRLPRYLRYIESGEIDVKAQPRLIADRAATFVIDGHHGLGPVAAMQASALAVERAKVAGVCYGLIRETTHTGAIGRYAQWIAERDCAAIVIAAGQTLMAYHGARVASLGTSPIAIAVPASNGPIVLDMATSTISNGKILQARVSNEQLPADTVLTAAGEATTDPRAAEIHLAARRRQGLGLELHVRNAGERSGCGADPGARARPGKAQASHLEHGHYRRRYRGVPAASANSPATPTRLPP